LQLQTKAGFTAVRNIYGPFYTGDIVVFDTEIYDASEAYDPGNGVYTCPADGVYQFRLVAVQCTMLH
jgi:hypothetical protein